MMIKRENMRKLPVIISFLFDHCSNNPANQIFLKVHRIPAPSLPHATMPPDWAPARLAHSNTVNNPLPFPCYILPSLMFENHVGALEVFYAGLGIW